LSYTRGRAAKIAHRLLALLPIPLAAGLLLARPLAAGGLLPACRNPTVQFPKNVKDRKTTNAADE
jgi:hypothetical protein